MQIGAKVTRDHSIKVDYASEALKHAGYTTFTSGKWHVASHRNPPSQSLPKIVDLTVTVRTHIDSYWKVLAGCDIYRDGSADTGDNENVNLNNPYQPEKDFYRILH